MVLAHQPEVWIVISFLLLSALLTSISVTDLPKVQVLEKSAEDRVARN